MKRTLLITLGLICLVAVLIVPQLVSETTAVTSYVANAIFKNNFHEVVAGKFYRASQMNRADIAKTIDKYGIKTIIDFRLDDDAPDKTGESEGEVAAKHGAEYVHIPMSSSRRDQVPQLQELLKTYDTAATPILVHCSSGTHRSGTASAIYLVDKEGRSIDVAAEQLTARYGFFAAERTLKEWTQGRRSLDKIIFDFQREVDNGEVKSSQFRDWLAKQQ